MTQASESAGAKEWRTVEPSSVQLDAEPLREMTRAIEADEFRSVNAVLVARHGNLAHEQYFNGFDASSLMNTRSTTKTVTGMLIGIAIDRGDIKGVDTPVMTFFADKQ